MTQRTGIASNPWRAVIGLLMLPAVGSAGEIVNGYTYVAPSYYLTPPVVVTGSVLVPPVPVRTISPVAVAPLPVVPVYEPAFLHTTVVPYNPVWPYAYQGLPGAYYRERVSVRPREVEYNLKTYGPNGGGRLTRYEVEYGRRGYEVEYKVRRR